MNTREEIQKALLDNLTSTTSVEYSENGEDSMIARWGGIQEAVDALLAIVTEARIDELEQVRAARLMGVSSYTLFKNYVNDRIKALKEERE